MIQFTVYNEADEISFVTISYGNGSKIPRVGDTIYFPLQAFKEPSNVENVVWHLYDDADPLIEVISRICLESKCREVVRKRVDRT